MEVYVVTLIRQNIRNGTSEFSVAGLYDNKDKANQRLYDLQQYKDTIHTDWQLMKIE